MFEFERPTQSIIFDIFLMISLRFTLSLEKFNIFVNEYILNRFIIFNLIFKKKIKTF
jgi:hypothetical protein